MYVVGMCTLLAHNSSADRVEESPGCSNAVAFSAGLGSKDVPQDAPPRVKAAMQAAMEYRKKKAAATAATANAAAAAAQLPPKAAVTGTDGVLRDVLVAQQAAMQAVAEAQDAERSVRVALQHMAVEGGKLPAGV